MNLMLPLLGLGAVGLLAMSRKANAADSPNLSEQTEFTQTVGKSGTPYAVSLGEQSESGQVVSVNNAAFEPLFTYIALPNGGKHYMGAAVGVEPRHSLRASPSSSATPSRQIASRSRP